MSLVLKRIFRTEFIFIWLIVLFVVYVIINHFFLRWVSSQNEHTLTTNQIDKLKFIGVHKQIAEIKERISNLQASLDRSKQNANELNSLMHKAFGQMKNSNQISTDNYKIPSRMPKDIKHEEKIAILVISCNRANAIDNHLKQLIEKRPGGKERFPIVVSQDCNNQPTAQAILKHSDQIYAYIKQPDLSDITVDKNGAAIPAHLRGYFKIARHFKFALEQVFMNFTFQSVIITEDDLNIGADFFEYFGAMRQVLANDTSLYCVSAWNDNGKVELINNDRPEMVHRTDFFPGLGWMMLRSLWLEYREKWPLGFWDDWMREPAQRNDRSCLRPEISRTAASGPDAKAGVSAGQFYDKYLKFIVLNDKTVNWSATDTTYLLKKNYEANFLHKVYNQTKKDISFSDYVKNRDELSRSKETILITYDSKQDFLNYANFFGIMNDFKAGVPRTAYKGIVRLFHNSNEIFLAPRQKLNWTGYPNGW